MEVSNVLKIVDLEEDQLPTDFVKWVSESPEPTYRDQQFEDHIYAMDDCLEVIEDELMGEGMSQDDHNAALYHSSIWNKLREIQTLIFDNEAGYFRIVHNM